MTVAFLCPGQGVQTPGMLDKLPDHPAVAATLAEASAVLGLDVRGLPRASDLHPTVAMQLGTVTAGVAAARALAAEGALPNAAAGLSVGAFTAAVICGALDFGAALVAVKYRAERMAAAFPTGYGLASLLGLNEPEVKALTEAIATPEAPVYLAIVNAPRHIVVAGSHAGLDRAVAEARTTGAHRAVRLSVGVPSHCPLLADVATDLGSFLAHTTVMAPRVPYVTNRGGRGTRDPEVIRADLATNLAFPVRWHDAVNLLVETGARLFVEVPPGHVLRDLAVAAFPIARAVSLADSSLATAVALVHRHGDPP
ncbi:ACP S-malonyltransferase [Chondromyces apiculatus]|uniref:[acyl-carrier-protein] S-malonyltransferase n=1 Tax=Chondromyces apiculatus DSM 436 TaxID=1192034 RepID=A0A017TDY7_9BACT|nr:malonate decarboxylase subunit epsilon [Chondromyces apiculatus]EYF07112.1 Malonyl CoA acyl carrier protein transacylase [Chondromyces apiculatus DSM 436]